MNKKYTIGAEITGGQCTLFVSAKSKLEAYAKAISGEVDKVESEGWNFGEVDETSIVEIEDPLENNTNLSIDKKGE